MPYKSLTPNNFVSDLLLYLNIRKFTTNSDKQTSPSSGFQEAKENKALD